MATHHATAGEVVDIATWANDLPEEKTKTIVKTDAMELARVVIPAGEEYPNHTVPGPIVVHCVQGKIQVSAMGATQELHAGQLLYLMANEPHVFKGVQDAVVLLTILFTS